MIEGDEDDGLESLRRLDRFIEGEDKGTTAFVELEKSGQSPPSPENLTDEEVTLALTNLVWSLYDLGVLVDDADHLNDRDLYKELLAYCGEANVFFPDEPDTSIHWSPIGGCSEEDTAVWLRFYADEETRDRWAKDFPDAQIAPSELPPYYRSWLPNRAPLDN